MKRNTRRKFLVGIFLSGLILKKAGFGLSIFLIFPSVILLCIEFLRSAFSRNHNSRVQLTLSFIFSIFFLVVMAQLQYWIPPLQYAFIFWSVWIVFSIVFLKYGKYGENQKFVWVVITLLLSAAAFMNPRQYHNFFKASYYEDYIRRHYTETQQEVADLYIDRFKQNDLDKSEQYLFKAARYQRVNENEKALRHYNAGLDYNPDNAQAYYDRGYFKLTRLELNSDRAYSAVKDFNRAIKLKPDLAKAYFYRALAVSYVGRHFRACQDYTKAKQLDRSLNVSEGLKSNCPRINQN